MVAIKSKHEPIRQNARQNLIRDPFFAVPYTETFAGQFNVINKTLYTYFDQALLDSQENALAMRRDGLTHELIRHRQTPVICLPIHTVVDDPDHPGQKSVADTLNKIIKDIPKLRYIMMSLMEAIFYGKYGVEMKLGPRKVSGNLWNSVAAHIPVNGDKIRYKRDGTPGIAIRSGSSQDFTDNENAFLNAYSDCIESSMLGEALFLNEPFLRDRYLIHNFEPFDGDYLFEIEQQLAVQGLGLRGRLYWIWNLRTELLSWMINALQRVGANGMIFGFYEEGNPEMKDAVLSALRQLVQDNYAAFPVRGGMSGAANSKGVIDRIEPASVGYDVLFQLIEWCEGIMRRAFLGQDLSSTSKPTGIGAGAAQLHGDVRADYIEYDASLLAETLTEQLLSVILKYNKFVFEGEEYYGDELPFSCRLEFQLTRENVEQAIAAAKNLFDMGVELDADDLRRKAGLAPPKRKETTISNPQIRQQQEQAMASRGMRHAGNRMDSFTRDMMKKVGKKSGGGGGSTRAAMGGHGVASMRRRRELAGAR